MLLHQSANANGSFEERPQDQVQAEEVVQQMITLRIASRRRALRSGSTEDRKARRVSMPFRECVSGDERGASSDGHFLHLKNGVQLVHEQEHSFTTQRRV